MVYYALGPTEIARQWLKRAQDAAEDHPFMRFIMLWIALNALYGQAAEQGIHHDSKKLDWYSALPDCQQCHKELLTKHGGYSSAVAQLKARGVLDMRSGLKKQIDDPNSLRDVMRNVYAIRNNLFHGQKVPVDALDMELVRTTVEILEPLLTELIELPPYDG